MDYKNKYLKYKTKYIKLKGGSIDTIFRISEIKSPYELLYDKTFDINKIEITDIPKKISSSKSFIIHGKYNKVIPIYCKLFYESESNLLVEKEIYEYVKEQSNIKPFIANHFIMPLWTFIEPIDTVKKLLNNQSFDTFCNKSQTNHLKINGILTFDYNYDSFDTLLKSTTDLDDIKFLIFELLYSIYVMHTELDIMHNDLHFDNILATKIQNPIINKYIINGNEYKISKKYMVRIFDFDRSSKIQKFTQSSPIYNNFIETEICKINGSCNKYSQKDIYILLVSIIRIKLQKNSHIDETQINDIFEIISDNDKELQTAIINNLNQIKKDQIVLQEIKTTYKTDDEIQKEIQKYNESNPFKTIFWSAFCNINNDQNPDNIRFIATDCANTDRPNLDINKVIERYLKYLQALMLPPSVFTDHDF
jgi:hypothetical protein